MTDSEKVLKFTNDFSCYIDKMRPDNMFVISRKGGNFYIEMVANNKELAIYAKILVRASPHVAEVLMVKLAEELQKFEMSKK